MLDTGIFTAIVFLCCARGGTVGGIITQRASFVRPLLARLMMC